MSYEPGKYRLEQAADALEGAPDEALSGLAVSRYAIAQTLECGCRIAADETRTRITVEACGEEHAERVWMGVDAVIEVTL
jgi:hypothetical protein